MFVDNFRQVCNTFSLFLPPLSSLCLLSVKPSFSFQTFFPHFWVLLCDESSSTWVIFVDIHWEIPIGDWWSNLWVYYPRIHQEPKDQQVVVWLSEVLSIQNRQTIEPVFCRASSGNTCSTVWYMYVCMCVCMYVYACMHACMYVCIYVCLLVCNMHACLYVYMYVCMYIMTVSYCCPSLYLPLFSFPYIVSAFYFLYSQNFIRVTQTSY